MSGILSDVDEVSVVYVDTCCYNTMDIPFFFYQQSLTRFACDVSVVVTMIEGDSQDGLVHLDLKSQLQIGSCSIQESIYVGFKGFVLLFR